MKPSLLDTSASSFHELLAAGRRFKVPAFQRDYSWKEEQWEDLWNDIIDLRVPENDNHYLGTIVIKNFDDSSYEIIDGQQRIATLTIIAIAVVSKLMEMSRDLLGDKANGERADLLRRRYIGDKDPTKLVHLSGLTLNENNDEFFQEYIVNEGNLKSTSGLIRSNKLILECLKYYRKKIDELDNYQASGEALAELLDSVVGKKLVFIKITVSDELNAYTVFETLNARGLELTSTDLLKNYLFSLVSEETRPALERKWKVIIGFVGNDQFPEFLRYFLLMRTSKVRTPRLFKIIKNRTKNDKDAIGLLDDLRPYAEFFSLLSDSNHEFWIEHPKAKVHVRDLILFKSKQMTPALFAAKKTFSITEFEKFIRYVVSFLFRYTIVGGRNTNALEPASSLVAQAILDGRATSARDASLILQDLYIDDNQLRSEFQQVRLPNNQHNRKIIKYILCNIEAKIAGRSCDIDGDSGTVEHVWSLSGRNSKKSLKDNDLVNSIGNLTLLSSFENRQAGSKPFADKVKIYAESQYAMTRELVADNPAEWNDEAILSRAQWLGRQAASIWRSGFD